MSYEIFYVWDSSCFLAKSAATAEKVWADNLKFSFNRSTSRAPEMLWF